MTDISQKQGGWTPGPLRRGYTDKMYLEINGPGGSYITLLDKWQRPIAFVPGDYIPGEIDPVMEANANLFAAASDLYGALDAIVPPALCGESWNLPDDERVEITISFGKLKAARAALSRANPSTDQDADQ